MDTASIEKWVFRFGSGSADGTAKDKAFLGGKGEIGRVDHATAAAARTTRCHLRAEHRPAATGKPGGAGPAPGASAIGSRSTRRLIVIVM